MKKKVDRNRGKIAYFLYPDQATSILRFLEDERSVCDMVLNDADPFFFSKERIGQAENKLAWLNELVGVFERKT